MCQIWRVLSAPSVAWPCTGEFGERMQKARLGVWMWKGLHGKFLQVPLQWCNQVWGVTVRMWKWLYEENLTASDDGGPRGQAVENWSGPVPGCCQLGLLWADAEGLHKVGLSCSCPSYLEAAPCFCLSCYLCQFFQGVLQNCSLFKNLSSVLLPWDVCGCQCVCVNVHLNLPNYVCLKNL